MGDKITLTKTLVEILGLPAWFVGGTVVEISDMPFSLVAKNGRYVKVYLVKDKCWVSWKPDVDLDSTQDKS